jgi:hypothetical protein
MSEQNFKATPSRFVTFIGGTAYSGSTLLDMILANDPTGFSCGEVGALVYPFRRHHRSPACGCGDPDCTIWRDPRAATTDVHRYLFDRFPELRFLVDSSKSVEWIAQQQWRLQAHGIGSSNVLIWKTPQEYYQSRKKRSEERGWLTSWLNYHKSYMAVFRSFTSIRYSDLVSSPASLEVLCRHLGISFWEGKIQYWNKEQHTLFGNSSAKIHLYPRDSSTHDEMHDELSRLAAQPSQPPGETFRSIYQETRSVAGPNLSRKQQRSVREVVEMIERRDVQTISVPGSADESVAAGPSRQPLKAKLVLMELYLKRHARNRLFELAGIER